MNFYSNYISLCNKVGKTPSAVALDLGLSKPTVNRWKNGGGVTDATAAKVANYFDVPVETLTEGTGSLDEMLARASGGAPEGIKKEPIVRNDELEKLGYYDLTPENRNMIDELIEKLLKSQSGA